MVTQHYLIRVFAAAAFPFIIQFVQTVNRVFRFVLMYKIFHKKSQRRTWRKNDDVRVEHHPAEFNLQDFELYQRYQKDWHNVESPISEIEYYEFLIESPVTTEILRYYSAGKLIGVGWIDRLAELVSSVYFVFDPEYVSRRLGVFSLLYEIEYTRFLDIRWLYLGYWVENSPKMNYKADFQPAQILRNSRWIPFEAQ